MSAREAAPHHHARRIAAAYLGALLVVAAVLASLHHLFLDLEVGGVRWFNLDRERNLPTWFSGVVFFLYGLAALVAFHQERTINARGRPLFRLPALWLGVVMAGWWMSLDEITILHENILWREVRLATDRLGGAWVHLTQWQVVFAPAILLVLGYMVVFFSNRFAGSRAAKRAAFTGIGLWLGALLLEGVRGTIREAGAASYSAGVLVEELMEMAGAVFLLGAIVVYAIDIALDLGPERRQRLVVASRFLTRRAALLLGITVLGLGISGGSIFWLARQQAAARTPLPDLHLRAREEAAGVETPGANQASEEVWFDQLRGVSPIGEADGEAIARFAAASLLSGAPGDDRVIRDRDAAPRLVFLSLSDGTSEAVVVRGSGNGIGSALEAALERAAELDGPWTWMKLDIVDEVHLLGAVDPASPQPRELDRTLYGVAFERASGMAFLPGEVASRNLIDADRRLRFDNLESYLVADPDSQARLRTVAASREPAVYRFSTDGYFSDGATVHRLYRGHRSHSQPALEDLLDAALAAGGYLERIVGPEGRFVYRYLPSGGSAADGYNMVRHAGTVYSMLELLEATGDPALRSAAEQAVAYLVATVSPCDADGEAAQCLLDEGEVKLGGNALAVLALAQHARVTGDRRYLPLAADLARWIRAVQSGSGEFVVHRQTYPDGEVSDFVSEYYPGEAVLALVRLHALDGDEAWLDAAVRGADWLIEERDGNAAPAELIHDHWLLYALDELHRLRPDARYLEHASRLAAAIMQAQHHRPPYPDWVGGYGEPPRSTPAATRSEGLAAAYRLARDFGTSREAQALLDALRLGISFQLQTQYRPESVLYFGEPQRALGGFRRSLTDDEIRIDYVQHNLSSLLALYHIDSS